LRWSCTRAPSRPHHLLLPLFLPLHAPRRRSLYWFYVYNPGYVYYTSYWIGYAPQSTSTQLDMMMLRDSAARSWQAWYKNPTDATFTLGTGSATLPDTQLTAYSGWSVVSRVIGRGGRGACAVRHAPPAPAFAGQLARGPDCGRQPVVERGPHV
jgi:hypothetical protein